LLTWFFSMSFFLCKIICLQEFTNKYIKICWLINKYYFIILVVFSLGWDKGIWFFGFDLFTIVKGIVHVISSVLLTLSGMYDSQQYSLHMNLWQSKDVGVKCLLFSCKIVYSCLQRTLDFAAEYKLGSIIVNTHISVLNMNTQIHCISVTLSYTFSPFTVIIFKELSTC